MISQATGGRAFAAILAIGLAGLASFPSPATADDDDVVTKMTAGRIERIMKSYRDVQDFKELENGTYAFQTIGLNVLIFNNGETLQLFSGFRDKATLSRINEWNRTKRFSRAYVDEKGTPCLEADLELTGGVTEKNIKEWMRTYISCLKGFKDHLAE